MELWVVYNKTSGQTYITKGRRSAERICSTLNKFHKLICSNEISICDSAKMFFNSHHIDKNKILFSWPISSVDRMNILKTLFKIKEFYG